MRPHSSLGYWTPVAYAGKCISANFDFRMKQKNYSRFNKLG